MTTIFRNGQFESHEWDSDKRAYVEEPINDIFDLAQHWNEPLVSFEGTLGELLAYLKRDWEGVSLIERLTRSSILPFLDEPLIGAVDDDPIDYLEVKKILDVCGYDGVASLEDYTHMSGRKNNDETSYGVEFSPLAELASCPIRVSAWAEFIDAVDSKNVHVRLLKHDVTLGEFFQAVFDEVSWNPSPEARAAKREEILGLAAECRERIPLTEKEEK
jgi:hypothetical protein